MQNNMQNRYSCRNPLSNSIKAIKIIDCFGLIDLASFGFIRQFWFLKYRSVPPEPTLNDFQALRMQWCKSTTKNPFETPPCAKKVTFVIELAIFMKYGKIISRKEKGVIFQTFWKSDCLPNFLFLDFKFWLLAYSFISFNCAKIHINFGQHWYLTIRVEWVWWSKDNSKCLHSGQRQLFSIWSIHKAMGSSNNSISTG